MGKKLFLRLVWVKYYKMISWEVLLTGSLRDPVSN